MAEKRRLAKLEKAVAIEIANALIKRVKDPRAMALISVTSVKISPDLSHARINYSVLGGEGEKRTAARMFESAHGYLQTLVAKRLETRTTPSLSFHYDASLEKQAEIASLIDEALAADRVAQAARGETVSAPAPKPQKSTAADGDDGEEE